MSTIPQSATCRHGRPASPLLVLPLLLVEVDVDVDVDEEVEVDELDDAPVPLLELREPPLPPT